MVTLRFFTDGGCRKNPGPAASAIYFPEHKFGFGKFIGNKTNNEAEAEALLMGIEYARNHKHRTLEVFMDSQLLVFLVNGIWRPSAQSMQTLVPKIGKAIADLDWHVDWVPRERNKEADWICNQVLDAQERGEYLTCPTIFKIPSSLCSATPSG